VVAIEQRVDAILNQAAYPHQEDPADGRFRRRVSTPGIEARGIKLERSS
jgi:hypothetical protein